jgi:hypothetical protein
MPSVLGGVDELIDQSLGTMGIGTLPHYRHKKSALLLRSKPITFGGVALIRQILYQIDRNWQVRPKERIRKASSENWRWKKQLEISECNRSEEKKIEKAIALEGDDNWVNQVPTSSGLLDATSERSCDIDLVHRVSEDEFEFIELKIDSDTPMFAAFEVLKYGMIYVFSRRHASELGYNADNILLNAKSIALCVLAPTKYYAQYNLRWLESELSNGLREFGSPDARMDFHFEHFPSSAGTLTNPVESRKRVYGNTIHAMS